MRLSYNAKAFLVCLLGGLFLASSTEAGAEGATQFGCGGIYCISHVTCNSFDPDWYCAARAPECPGPNTCVESGPGYTFCPWPEYYGVAITCGDAET